MLHVMHEGGWLDWDFSVRDESGLVGEISVGSRFVASVVTVGDETYSGRVAGGLRHHYFMESGDVEVAHAQSLASSGWDCAFEYSGAKYTLRERSWSSTVDLVKDNTVVGSLARTGWFSGVLAADLPHDLPVQIKFFIIWLRLFSSKFQSG